MARPLRELQPCTVTSVCNKISEAEETGLNGCPLSYVMNCSLGTLANSMGEVWQISEAPEKAALSAEDCAPQPRRPHMSEIQIPIRCQWWIVRWIAASDMR